MTVHIPVLLEEIIASLDLGRSADESTDSSHQSLTVVDGTLGAGGHARRIIAEPNTGLFIGLDRDPSAALRTRDRLYNEFPDKAEKGLIRIFAASYRELPSVMTDLEIESVDRILLDLGLSSDQLEDRTRGFSFRVGGDLDLRFNPTEGISAADWLKRSKEEEIANRIYQFGEERFSRRIARAICETRRTTPIETAEQLAAIVHRCVPGKSHGRIDPATRTFQALRIVVNNELDHLESSLQVLPNCIKPGGLLLAISFHSLEDRLLKNAFRDNPILEKVNKKPIVPSEAETDQNSRSRSAKLRIARRV